MLVKPVLSSRGLHYIFLPGVLGPLFVAPNSQDRDGCTEAKKLEMCTYFTAVAYPNAVIPPPSLLCCSPPATHNR
jgi:hypothetical protein